MDNSDSHPGPFSLQGVPGRLLEHLHTHTHHAKVLTESPYSAMRRAVSKAAAASSPAVGPIQTLSGGKILVRLHVKPGAKQSQVVAIDDAAIGLQVGWVPLHDANVYRLLPRRERARPTKRLSE